MASTRIERVQHQIQTEIAQIIDRELKNPNLPEMITVSHVKLASDLSEATIFFTLLIDDSEEAIRETTKELNHSAGFIRSKLAKRVTLRKHPRLHFRYNPSTNYALGMEPLFLQIKDELDSMPADAPSTDEDENTPKPQ